MSFDRDPDTRLPSPDPRQAHRWKKSVGVGAGGRGSTVPAALLVLAAACCVTPLSAQTLEGDGALIGGTLVDGTGAAPVPDAVVVFRDGRIVCAGPAAECAAPPDLPSADVTGRFVVPGLIDGHVHYSQTGWADGRPDQAADLRDEYPYAAAMAQNRAHPERYFRAYLCSGVTATWDVGGYPWTWDLRARAESDPLAPRVAAAGPLLSARDHWLNLPAERQFLYLADAETVADATHYLLRSGTDQVKVWYLVEEGSPRAEHYREMLRIAARLTGEAEVPLIVHATGLWQAKDALRAGASHLVHSVYDQEVDDEFLELARERGVSYNPTLTVFDGILQFAERRFDDSHLDLGCIDPGTLAKARSTSSVGDAPADDTIARRRQAAEERYRLMLLNLRKVHEAGIPVVMGTDAGNTLTLHGPAVFAEMEAMQEAGLSPMDVLVASTLNVAVAMGRGADLGSVEEGKVADLVVLESDPTADIANARTRVLVIRGGWLHRVDDLRYR